KLVPVEPAAALVRELFAMALSGMTPGAIADVLVKRGERTRTWSRGVVRAMLVNPVYTGDAVIGRRTQGKHHRLAAGGMLEPAAKPGVRVIRNRPATTWIVRTAAHEALLSRDDFEAVQRLLSGRCRQALPDNRTPTRRGSAPLSGLLVCAGCGGVMVSEAKK